MVAAVVSYLRRFAGKFVEILAAGIGTAVSGYLVAYVAGHFAFFTPAAVKPIPPQTISSPAEPRDNASIDATVRAALASHAMGEAAPPAATPASPISPPPVSTSMAPTSSMAPSSATAAAPPLATTEIKTLPVAAADPPLPAETDAWPPDPAATGGAGRPSAEGRWLMLPPQPPPAKGDLLTALKRFF